MQMAQQHWAKEVDCMVETLNDDDLKAQDALVYYLMNLDQRRLTSLRAKCQEGRALRRLNSDEPPLR